MKSLAFQQYLLLCLYIIGIFKLAEEVEGMNQEQGSCESIKG